MKKILIASGNAHKIIEIKSVLNNIKNIEILSLNDFGLSINVIEDAATLEGNAFKKAKKIYNVFNVSTVSDDTGLFVDALNGEPGVYSARYAGEDASYSDNCLKLQANIEDVPPDKRTARFVSVICFYQNDVLNNLFRGVCEGKIIDEPRGKKGFGYDPLFVPAGFDKTFAEMTDVQKNNISHRGKALEEFKNFLKENSG